MRYPILISIFLLTFFPGCKKDKFSTTPSLKFESVNTTELHQGQSIRFTLSFTDKEGDLTDNLIINKFVASCVASRKDTLKYPLPPFPSGKNQSGKIIVTFGYNDIPPRCFPRNDTAVFTFVLRDKAQHSSDTATSPPIIIVNQ